MEIEYECTKETDVEKLYLLEYSPYTGDCQTAEQGSPDAGEGSRDNMDKADDCILLSAAPQGFPNNVRRTRAANILQIMALYLDFLICGSAHCILGYCKPPVRRISSQVLKLTCLHRPSLSLYHLLFLTGIARSHHVASSISLQISSVQSSLTHIRCQNACTTYAPSIESKSKVKQLPKQQYIPFPSRDPPTFTPLTVANQKIPHAAATNSRMRLHKPLLHVHASQNAVSV